MILEVLVVIGVTVMVVFRSSPHGFVTFRELLSSWLGAFVQYEL